jgi:hypothetical protein
VRNFLPDTEKKTSTRAGTLLSIGQDRLIQHQKPICSCHEGTWNAVRITYPLEWFIDESLRRTVRNEKTKIEWHHNFSKHLTFDAGGHLRSNDPADQEKTIVFNELATNAVALQNVVDQTRFSVNSHHMTLTKVANGSELAAAAVATA